MRAAARGNHVHSHRLLTAHTTAVSIVFKRLQVNIALGTAYFLTLHTRATLQDARGGVQRPVRDDNLRRALFGDASVDNGLNRPSARLGNDKRERVRAVFVIFDVECVYFDTVRTLHGEVHAVAADVAIVAVLVLRLHEKLGDFTRDDTVESITAEHRATGFTRPRKDV